MTEKRKNMKKITEIENLKSKRVLLRLDLNVHIENGEIKDDYRIKRSMKTLEFLRVGGAKTVIIAHLDEKEGKTLKPVYEYLKKELPISFSNFADTKSSDIKDGEFLLLENIRENKGEMENSEEFAKKLSSLGELYINEAFSVSHREHASIVGVPKLIPSYAGFLFSEEVENLSKAFNPERPFLFILAGAKFETKMPLVEKFLDLADTCFVGGALSNDIFKARGLEIGKSLVSDQKLDLSRRILSNSKLQTPTEVVVFNKGKSENKNVKNIEAQDNIVDAGEKTIKDLAKLVDNAKFVLWNGTLGYYEKGFGKATCDLAKIIADSNAYSIVGGGDTLASISKLGILDKFSFVSTGGGAMLDFLATGTLPGIVALQKTF